MPARPIPVLDAILLPLHTSSAKSCRPDSPSPRAFVRSVMPALDLAFGLEDIANVPPDIAGWLARLAEGPLGREPDEGGRLHDWATAMAA